MMILKKNKMAAHSSKRNRIPYGGHSLGCADKKKSKNSWSL
jgi:hypothetical protein